MREELALKASIFAENFAPDLSWYGISTLLLDGTVEHEYVSFVICRHKFSYWCFQE